ncbi:hypothetical protein BC567DRAFT_232388 [Phyllosticta citribraziliensis]
MVGRCGAMVRGVVGVWLWLCQLRGAAENVGGRVEGKEAKVTAHATALGKALGRCRRLTSWRTFLRQSLRSSRHCK